MVKQSNNDDRILELRKQIEAKKADLSKQGRFAPVTNCSIELGGQRYNINAADKTTLLHLLVNLNVIRLSYVDLEMDSFSISGFEVVEWIEDIKAKLATLEKREEENKLKSMEAKLTQLLSERKKVELELDDIESQL